MDRWLGVYKEDAKGAILEWFSEEVPHSWADWMTYKRDPKRVIATLELLASVVAVKLWMPQGARAYQGHLLSERDDGQFG